MAQRKSHLIYILAAAATFAQARSIAPVGRVYEAAGGNNPTKQFETIEDAVAYAEQGHCASLLLYNNAEHTISNCRAVNPIHLSYDEPQYVEGYSYTLQYDLHWNWTGVTESSSSQTGGSIKLFCPQLFSRHRHSHCWTSDDQVDPEKGPPKNSCPIGNPIEPANRKKYQVEREPAFSLGKFDFYYRYDSGATTNASSLGYGWRHAFDGALLQPAVFSKLPRRNYIYAPNSVDDPGLAADGMSAGALLNMKTLERSDHRITTFYKKNESYLADTDINEGLIESVSTAGEAGFLLYDQDKGRIERYNASGRLAAIWDRSGDFVEFNFSDATTPALIAPRPGLVIGATRFTGQNFKFNYDSFSRISKLTTSPGIDYIFNYLNDTLGSITYPTNDTKRFLYDEVIYTGGSTRQNLLTGIIDESQQRYSTFSYDTYGTKSTQHAGGISKFEATLTGQNPTQVTLVTPNGSSVTEQYRVIKSQWALHSTTQEAGAGCFSASNQIRYDANGNTKMRDDFNGKRVCYSHDGKNREAVRIEGLPGGANIPEATCDIVLASNAALPTDARKTSTEWHPDWKLETRRAEPKKRTTWVYNGQPDPFNGNALASCAPSTALLPDAKPIAVLCKQVEQATLDANGSQGFAATLAPNEPYVINQRQTSFTYNQYGQVLTGTDERGKVTTNTYYQSTTANYTKGDLATVTNPKNHVVRYTRYNPHGQVLEMLDANDVATVYTYDLRQRMTSVTQAGQLTTTDWWPTGLLKKVTQPDGSW
ncbi:MAG: RHS repeat protein, partial [Sphingobacteriales bacterium]